VMTHFIERVHGAGYHPYQDYYLGPTS